MNPVSLPASVLFNLPVAAFNFPHLFATEFDDKRTGRAIYRRMLTQLAVGVADVTIHVNNTFSISYTNGALYRSVECIGSTGSSAYTLQAILDSRVKILVEHTDDDTIVLNDTAEYKARVVQVENTEE